MLFILPSTWMRPLATGASTISAKNNALAGVVSTSTDLEGGVCKPCECFRQLRKTPDRCCARNLHKKEGIRRCCEAFPMRFLRTRRCCEHHHPRRTGWSHLVRPLCHTSMMLQTSAARLCYKLFKILVKCSEYWLLWFGVG